MGSGELGISELIDAARAVEQERRRIARGLHDQVGTQIREAIQLLESAASSPEVEQAKARLVEALKATRSLTFELGLPESGEYGLAGVLETLCRRTDAGHELDVFFEEHGDPQNLDEGIILVVAQIVRELLLNVVKHSRANVVAVNLIYLPDRLQISVTDDGVGLTGPIDNDGFGLADSRSRVCELGGRFEFGTRDGLGTRVVLEVPVS